LGDCCSIQLSFIFLCLTILFVLVSRDRGRDNCTENSSGRDDAVADIAGVERDTLFWFDEALLGDEAKDHLSYSSAAAHCLEVAESCSFPASDQSTGRISFSPRRDHRCNNDVAAAAVADGWEQGGAKDILKTVSVAVADDVPTAADGYRHNIPVAASPENVSVQGKQSA
jgi:hypothetical protein